MKKILVAMAALSIGLSSHALAQTGSNGAITGIVQDPSGALIPGVSISVTNTGTGISASQVTNESGAYNFPSVSPGKYTVAATLPGFKTAVFNDTEVAVGVPLRLNFTMQIGEVSSQVEVSVSAQQLLTEASASVGNVLPEYKVRELPLVTGDVLDLIKIMPGWTISFGAAFGTLNGLGSSSINTVRDGLSVSDGRNQNGIFATTTINPEMVSEIRMIMSPVDAEMGRGNAQVTIQTRSGTNRFAGSAVWDIRNSALNANTWANNRTTAVVDGVTVWRPTPADWRNTHQFTLSYGGPIIRNKTFFFALWDQNMSNTRTLVSNTVLTDSARQGIFRYFTGWNSGNALTPVPTFPANATTGTYPVVDYAGNPVRPPLNPNGTPYTGGLQCYSVFGNVKVDGTPFTAADCPGGTAIIGAAWDGFRPRADSTGYIAKILNSMPHANFFAPGGTTVDGLNLAQFQWVRGRNGSTGANTGTNPAVVDRKQLNVKIDHNFNARHRLSVSWSYQADDSADNLSSWPGGFNGTSTRRPQVATANFTSTLSANLVNEARVGITYGANNVDPAWYSTNPEVKHGAEEFLLSGGAAPGGGAYPVLFTPGAGNFAFGNHMINAGSTYSGSSSPLYNLADTLSWTRGRHAFRMGGDVRLTRSSGFSGAVFPTASGGAGGNPSALATPIVLLPSQLQTNQTNAANMLYFLAGSVNTASTLYWINSDDDVKNGTWQDLVTAGKRVREQISNELSGFFKDDWKLTKNLTLNLGVRYEYYGSPYIKGGFTTSVEGQGAGLFGNNIPTNGLFDWWMLKPGSLYLTGYGPNVTAESSLQCVSGVTQSPLLPTSTCDPNKLTKFLFVGPGTDNPKLKTIPDDLNNFGPAVGFAWQVPWFGAGKTSVRGGVQVTFGGAGRNGNTLDNVLGNAPGNTSTANLLTSDFPQLTTNRALSLVDLPLLVPTRPTSPALPGGSIPVYGRTTAATAYDPSFATPYATNYTLSVSRALSRAMTLDLKYTGTMGKKRAGTTQASLNLNLPNIYYNKELWDALEITRAGGDAPLFDQMFAGLDLHGTTGTGYGQVGTVVGGVLQHGSAHLRRNATFTQNLANGNFIAVANSLNTLTTVQSGLMRQPITSGVGGTVLRNGCDRLAAGLTNISTRCFPEDYIVTNPQLGTASYITNNGSSNYHGLQTTFTLRPTHGLNFQNTYTWSKLLGVVPNGVVDPLDREADYSLPVQNVKHDIRFNGGFELPVGPNRLLFGNSSGWAARLIEGWKTAVIFNWTSGNPRQIVGTPGTTYATGNMNNDVSQHQVVIVSPTWDLDMHGHAQWDGPNNDTGTYYRGFTLVPDPQCALMDRADTMGFNLSANCTLSAVALRNPDGTAGALQIVNSRPGQRGNMLMPLETLGKWSMDANFGKTFQLSESKTLQVRFDATNVLNHPAVNDYSPQTNQNINTAGVTFGALAGKGGLGAGDGARSFQAQIRVGF